MLRCQGIPARVVLCYRGAELSGVGTYVVRQCNAHSWVDYFVGERVLDSGIIWIGFTDAQAV